MRWQSLMTDLGLPPPEFVLPDAEGRRVRLVDVYGTRVLLVAFICNHCPFVQHMIDEFVTVAGEFSTRGIGTVAISSNDVAAHPEDGPEEMVRFARAHRFAFPYLYDETQAIAKAYRAACTPDLFLYDGSRRLYYRGQFDGSRPATAHTRPASVPVPGGALRDAAARMLAGAPPPDDQRASMGCSLKWKPGNEPPWG